MFDDNQEPKDMFADVPDNTPKPAQPAAASVANPVPAAPVQPAPQPQQMPQQQVISPAQAMQYETPKSSGAWRIIVIVTISLICMGAAGYAAYRFMVRDAVSQQVSDVIGGGETESDEEEDSPATTDDEETDEGKGGDENEETDEETNDDDDGPTAVVDSDGDGLSNDEEREAGTSVAKPDTDGDGLGDREEVKVYDTDPKETDTDGDGYIDGDEVKNGYNPNGEGKLLQLPE